MDKCAEAQRKDFIDGAFATLRKAQEDKSPLRATLRAYLEQHRLSVLAPAPRMEVSS